MPTVVYLHALTFILQFCFAMFFFPPSSILLQKPETSRKHPSLNITGTFSWSFFFLLRSFCKITHCVCCKIAFVLSEIAVVFTATVCPISARSCIMYAMICIECPCTTFVLQLDQNHGREDELCNHSVWYLRLDKNGDLCGAKLFLSLCACIAQWISGAMVVHMNLAKRFEIYI